MYWEDHDFSSLEGFSKIKDAENKFRGYIDLLYQVPQERAFENMRIFLDSAKKNDVAYMVWAGWFASAFRAMDSPYRSDAFFKEWFAKVEEDKVLEGDYMLEEFRQIRELMELNLIGDMPQDLKLTNYEGAEFNLSDLKGKKTVLLFVDANCPSCLESLQENLKEYGNKKVELVAVLVNGGKFHVNNIRQQLPEEVISKWSLVWCRDRELERGSKYDLSQLSFRMMTDTEGKIIKSYY